MIESDLEVIRCGRVAIGKWSSRDRVAVEYKSTDCILILKSSGICLEEIKMGGS